MLDLKVHISVWLSINSHRSECLCSNAQAEPTPINVDVDHGLDKSFRPDYCLHHFDSTAADLGPGFAKYL